jgi:hypothetical protein
MMLTALVPPLQYDHAYNGPVIEQRLSALEVFFLCHGPTTACSWVSKRVCHIVFSNSEKDDRAIALIRRHETAHCNGWPASHPGGRWVDAKSGYQVAAPKMNQSGWILF